jgi:hypothetical protein
MNQSTPLQRARRDDQNGYIIWYIWSPREKDITSLMEYNLGSF